MGALWKPPSDREWPTGRVLTLLGLTCFTALAAVASAHAVAVVASLAGSLLTMTTSVLFPALLHLVLSRQERRLCTAEYMVHGSVLIFGIVMASLGTALALQDLRDRTY